MVVVVVVRTIRSSLSLNIYTTGRRCSSFCLFGGVGLVLFRVMALL